METLIPNFSRMSDMDKVKTILCPVTPQTAKLIDKFLGIMFRARETIDSGDKPLEYPTWVPNTLNPFVNDDQDNESFYYNATDVTFASDDSTISSDEH